MEANVILNAFIEKLNKLMYIYSIMLYFVYTWIYMYSKI